MLLAIAAIAASNIVQPAKASCSTNTGSYGKGCISGNANPNVCAEGTSQCGSGFGGAVSGLAQSGSGNGVGLVILAEHQDVALTHFHSQTVHLATVEYCNCKPSVHFSLFLF